MDIECYDSPQKTNPRHRPNHHSWGVNMLTKSHTFKLFSYIVTLFLFTFIAHFYLYNVYMEIESMLLKRLLFISGILFLLYVCNQVIYHYGKKEENFMQHNIWNKMFIIIFLVLMISFTLFIVLFFTTPLERVITSHTWLMLIIIYYFLFVFNFFVLSIVHIIANPSLQLEKKITITWAASSLLITIMLFVLPTI